jgi:hypothetical protein
VIKRIQGRGGRPSPALIVAVIALVAALAGTAVAADPSTRKITKSKVKTIAVKQINKAAPDLAVASADTAGSADNVLWAVVANGAGANDAALARAGQDGTTVSEPASPAVNVDFGRAVTECAWIATKGAVANATPLAGEITTEGVAANPNAVQVRTRTSAGLAVQDSFHVQLIC